jgi:hypothetical protein
MFKNFKEKVSNSFKNTKNKIKARIRTAQGNKERLNENIKTKLHKMRTDPYKGLYKSEITVFDGIVKSKPIGIVHKPKCVTFNPSIQFHIEKLNLLLIISCKSIKFYDLSSFNILEDVKNHYPEIEEPPI